MKGQAVRVKHGSGLKLHLSKVQHKKHHSTKLKGKGYNLTFDPYQMQMGKGFLDDLESFSLKALPALTDAGKAMLSVAPEALTMAGMPQLAAMSSYLTDEYTKPKAKARKRGAGMADFGDASGKFIQGAMRDTPDWMKGPEKDPLAFLYGGRLNAHCKRSGMGLMDVVKALAPHAKKALISVGKEAGKQLLTKGLEHAQKKALEHGIPAEKIHQSKQIAHALAQGQPVEAEKMVREAVEGTLQKHPQYEKVQGLMRQMFGHGHGGGKGIGGRLLIDEPFSARQAVGTVGDFAKNPLGTLGFGMRKARKAPVGKNKPKKGGRLLIDEPFSARQVADTAGELLKSPASALGFGMKYKLGGALMPAGY